MKLLNEIQQHLKAPKNQYNKFGDFKYRNCEDIFEAVKPHLGAGTLVLNDEIVQIGERFYVKATATLSDGKDNVSVSAYARETLERTKMDSSQLTGAASSYARKYALNGLFLIDDTKDADTQDNSEKREPMKSYTVSRKVASSDDEAEGAVIKDRDIEEIRDYQKDEIKDLLASHGHEELTKAEARKIVKELTELDLSKQENWEEIIKRLREGLDKVDPLADAIK